MAESSRLVRLKVLTDDAKLDGGECHGLGMTVPPLASTVTTWTRATDAALAYCKLMVKLFTP